MNGSCIGKMNDYPFFCNLEHSHSLTHHTNTETDTLCRRKDSCTNDYSRVQNILVLILLKGSLKTFKMVNLIIYIQHTNIHISVLICMLHAPKTEKNGFFLYILFVIIDDYMSEIIHRQSCCFFFN